MKNIKLIHEIRAIKSKSELRNIIKAQRISEKVLRYIVAKLKTRATAGQVGITEIEVANLIKKTYISYGVNVLSFPPIVAFGKNTANIHHQPNKTKLKRGDTIMLDFGCAVNHYCSDMTRTFFFGEPSKRQKRVYQSVLSAMEKALRKIEKGEKRAKVIDKAARGFLAKRFKNNFKHGLGHGVCT